MGNLRAQLGRVMGARGSWVVCSLVLASPLLTGCNETSATGAAPAATAASGPGSQSLSLSTVPTRASTSSTPAPSNKSVDVTWSAPTANTNGSALTNLAGYTIHYGTSATSLSKSVSVPSAGATDYVVQGLTGGTWYFAVTAYTNTGLQSSYSSVVSKTIS